MADKSLDLQHQLRHALDRLVDGGPPPEDLELILLRADHALRSRQGQVQDMRRLLIEQVDDLQVRLDHMAVLRDVGNLLGSHPHIDELLDRLPALLRGCFDCDAASIWLLDEERGCLEVVGADPLRPGTEGGPLPLDRGVAAWAVRQGRSRLVRDTELDPVFQADLEEGRTEPARTLLCVPLIMAGKVAGLVQLSCREPQAMDERDAALLDLIAPPVALAISRGRLHESFRLRLADQTRELQDVRDFFQSIVTSSDDLIVVLSPAHDMVLVSTALEGLLGRKVGDFLNRPVEGHLLEAGPAADLRALLARGESLRDQDVQLRHVGGSPVHASLNASPIHSSTGELLGTLCIFRSIERRVRTHHELSRLNTRLNALFEAAVDLASSLDLQQVLDRTLAWIPRLMEADEARLFLLSPDGRHLVPVRGEEAELAQVLLVEECPEGIVVRQQKPILLAEPGSVRQFLPEDAARIQSCIMVPLKVQDEVLGVLRVESHATGRLFSHQDMRLCSTFTSHAAMAIENSRLYAATQRESSRLHGLLDLSRRIRELRGSAAILAQFASAALELDGVQAVVAWEYRRSEHQLRRACALSKGLKLELAEGQMPAGGGPDDPLPFLLANRERRLRFRTMPEHMPPWAPQVAERGRAISLLAVPVVDGPEVFGLLLCYGDESLASLDADEGFISVLALQAAVAIHSQRLLQENQAAREFLSSVVASATEAIVVTDRQGRITLFNPGAEAMTGRRADDMVGKAVPGLYPGADSILGDLRRSTRHGLGHLTVETVLHGVKGDVPVQMTLSWMRDARGRILGVLGVAKDMGELKKLEQARLEAERLSGIERMAVTVSDRINTPLAVILAQVEMVRMLQPGLSTPSEGALASIEAQVTAVKDILDQLNRLKDPRVKEYALPNVHMYELEEGSAPARGPSRHVRRPVRRKGGGREEE